jgi:hypothetical protein
MPKFKKNVEIAGVDRIHRPSLGYVYKGTINIADVAEGLADGDLKYAPKYQRGAQGEEFDNSTLLEVTNERLDIDQKRAAQMAAKYLMGLDDSTAGSPEHRELFNPDIIWNARLEDGKVPEYNAAKRTLTAHTTITIPDSAHRHFMYYRLNQWKLDPDAIPDEVEISPDGRTIDGLRLQQLLQKFDPNDDDHSSVFVTIFNVTREYEGRLFDEYNVEGKKPTAGAAIDMFPEKTAPRRFITDLMKRCEIFDRDEIEMRASSIAKASRKITTSATLDAAAKQFQKDLLRIQKDKKKYDDLLEFFSHFYTEWANHYPAFEPTASGKLRTQLREQSFAMSNIMFFPMFRLAHDLWQKYTKAGIDWRSEKEWKDALAKLAGKVTVTTGDNRQLTVLLMARDYDDEEGLHVPGNPDWQGKILLQQFDQSGKPTGWSLSSTRQSREAAYHYLVKHSGVAFASK